MSEDKKRSCDPRGMIWRRCVCAQRTAIGATTPLALALVLVLILGVVDPAVAAITGFSLDGGQAAADGGVILVLTDPIGTIAGNGFEDDNIRIFDEVQGLTLTSTLILDDHDPAIGTNLIGAGSVVSSHYLFFDPDNAGQKDAIGTVTFDEPILGIIRVNTQFTDSNGVLGNPTATYSITNPRLESNDTVTFSGNVLSFDITARNPGDGVRIVTGVNPVPGINICGVGQTTIAGVVTGGQALAAGGEVIQVCDPVGDVGDNNYQSPDVFAFEEQQAVLLQADLILDSMTLILAGETVSSFYVVFDPSTLTTVQATIDFPDTIIGVIVDQQELNDSTFLGNASANYLSPGLLGLESGDTVSILGNQLSIDISANSPGDSVRVILGSASPSLSFNPCMPAETTLSGTVTGGTSFLVGGVFTQLCDPIGSVGNDNFQSNDLFAFEEAQNFPLEADLTTDDGPMGTIVAGTYVSSYYVAFDPSNNADVIGSIQFPGAILGIMTSTSTLNASDTLGNATAIYLNPSLRGLEGGIDVVSVLGDTLSVDLSASSPGDYLRVVIAGTSPPLVPALGPFGLVLASMLCAGLGVWFGDRSRVGRSLQRQRS